MRSISLFFAACGVALALSGAPQAQAGVMSPAATPSVGADNLVDQVRWRGGGSRRHFGHRGGFHRHFGFHRHWGHRWGFHRHWGHRWGFHRHWGYRVHGYGYGGFRRACPVGYHLGYLGRFCHPNY